MKFGNCTTRVSYRAAAVEGRGGCGGGIADLGRIIRATVSSHRQLHGRLPKVAPRKVAFTWPRTRWAVERETFCPCSNQTVGNTVDWEKRVP